MRSTNLKRTKRGYVRNLGCLPNRGQPKFYLGHEREEAVRRLERIVGLWQIIEEIHASGRRPGPAAWDQDNLDVAKELAKGGTPKLKKGDYEPPED